MHGTETYPDKSPQTASRIIDGEAVIIIPDKDEVKVLNEVGSRLWELCNGSRDRRQIAMVMAHEFDVSYEEALEDMTEFIHELYQKNMLVLLDHPKDNPKIQDR